MKSEFEPHAGISWHALPPQTVRDLLSTSPDVLTESEAQARLARYGRN